MDIMDAKVVKGMFNGFDHFALIGKVRMKDGKPCGRNMHLRDYMKMATSRHRRVEELLREERIRIGGSTEMR